MGVFGRSLQFFFALNGNLVGPCKLANKQPVEFQQFINKIMNNYAKKSDNS